MPNRAIATLRRAQFDIRVRSSKTENLVHGWSVPPQEDEYTPVNQARCSNKLLEHLDHLPETNELFGNVAKEQIEEIWNERH